MVETRDQRSAGGQNCKYFLFREAERDQTRTGVSRIMNWAVTSGLLEDDDLLISASVDEVMSRQALHQLRWCQLAGDVVFGGLWMPMGNLKKVKYEMTERLREPD